MSDLETAAYFGALYALGVVLACIVYVLVRAVAELLHVRRRGE